jgi:hypothetical protein
MPAVYNWLVLRSRPLWDNRNGNFTEPDFPWNPIKILHLAGGRPKRDAMQFIGYTGENVNTVHKIRYSLIKSLRQPK